MIFDFSPSHYSRFGTIMTAAVSVNWELRTDTLRTIFIRLPSLPEYSSSPRLRSLRTDKPRTNFPSLFPSSGIQ